MLSIFKRFYNVISILLCILFVTTILVCSVRGLPGNPTPSQLNTLHWKDNGPFELSPERGRFTLLYSLVANHSFQLDPLLAKFTTPDVGYLNHQYVSIFAPSISFIAIPGYIIGKYFGISQFGTFLWMSLFALLNVLLIRSIAIRFGANKLAATIGALIFLFATPAFAYAVTLYEHHVSTFLLLLSLYILIQFNSLFSLLVIWLIYAFSFTVDYPNLFLLFPIAFAAFLKSAKIDRVQDKFKFNLSIPRLLTVVGVILPLLFLLWVNQMSYNNPFRLSGTVPTVDSVSSNGSPVFYSPAEKAQNSKNVQPENGPPPSALTFFEPRNMIDGFYILLFSPDRGVLTYAPIIFLGIAGFFIANRKKHPYLTVTTGIVGVNFILYTMWGDPYGGWAFGGRYLIPSYAIIAIYIGILLTHFKKKKIFLAVFGIIVGYCVFVNTLGALTSNSNPPKIQAVQLSNQIHKNVLYTYMRNADDLDKGIVKSYVYQVYARKYMNPWQFYFVIVVVILSVFILGFVSLYLSSKKGVNKEKKYAV